MDNRTEEEAEGGRSVALAVTHALQHHIAHHVRGDLIPGLPYVRPDQYNLVAAGSTFVASMLLFMADGKAEEVKELLQHWLEKIGSEEWNREVAAVQAAGGVVPFVEGYRKACAEEERRWREGDVQ